MGFNSYRMNTNLKCMDRSVNQVHPPNLLHLLHRSHHSRRSCRAVTDRRGRSCLQHLRPLLLHRLRRRRHHAVDVLYLRPHPPLLHLCRHLLLLLHRRRYPGRRHLLRCSRLICLVDHYHLIKCPC